MGSGDVWGDVTVLKVLVRRRRRLEILNNLDLLRKTQRSSSFFMAQMGLELLHEPSLITPCSFIFSTPPALTACLCNLVLNYTLLLVC